MTTSKTIEDAERGSGGLDCRQMEPVVISPDCSFLRCQIGKYGADRSGDTVFQLLACGRSWEAALENLRIRKR